MRVFAVQFLAIFHGIQLVGDFIRAMKYFGLAVSFFSSHSHLIAAHFFAFVPLVFPFAVCFTIAISSILAHTRCCMHLHFALINVLCGTFSNVYYRNCITFIYIYLFYSKLVSVLFIVVVVVVEVARKRGGRWKDWKICCSLRILFTFTDLCAIAGELLSYPLKMR